MQFSNAAIVKAEGWVLRHTEGCLLLSRSLSKNIDALEKEHGIDSVNRVYAIAHHHSL